MGILFPAILGESKPHIPGNKFKDNFPLPFCSHIVGMFFCSPFPLLKMEFYGQELEWNLVSPSLFLTFLKSFLPMRLQAVSCQALATLSLDLVSLVEPSPWVARDVLLYQSCSFFNIVQNAFGPPPPPPYLLNIW